MDCESARQSISVRVDGELPSALASPLDRHLSQCPACTAWEEDAYALRRTVALRQPLPPADLTDQVLNRLSVPDVGSGQWVRIALALVAALLVVANAPLLLGLSSEGPVHESRHLGTFGVALGIGLLWAAWRPERANGLVPLAGALAATMLIGALVDVTAGRADVLTEASHTLEVAGLALLWQISGGRRRFTAHLRSWRRPAPLHSI